MTTPSDAWFRLSERGTMAAARTLERLSRPLDLRPRIASLKVVVDQPYRLHEGIDRGGADESPAATLEVPGQRPRLGGRCHRPFARDGRSSRLEPPYVAGQ